MTSKFVRRFSLSLAVFISGCSGCSKPEAEPVSSNKSVPDQPDVDPHEPAPEKSDVTSSDPMSKSTERAEIDATQDDLQRDAVNDSSSASDGKPHRSRGPSTPAEALADANKYKAQSEAAASGDDFGRAFELAVKGWEATQNFPDDAACQQLGEELLKKIDLYGNRANATRKGGSASRQPLIVK